MPNSEADNWQVAGLLWPGGMEAEAARSQAGDERARQALSAVATILGQIVDELGVNCAGCSDHIASARDLGGCAMAWRARPPLREVTIPTCRSCAVDENALGEVLEQVVERLHRYDELTGPSATRH